MTGEIWLEDTAGSLLVLHKLKDGYGTDASGEATFKSYEEAEFALTLEHVPVDGRFAWSDLHPDDTVEWVEVWTDGADAPVLKVLRKAADHFEICADFETVERSFTTYEAAADALRQGGFAMVISPDDSFRR